MISIQKHTRQFRLTLKKHRLLLAVTSILMLASVATLYLFYPRSTAFAYAGGNCLSKYVFLPFLQQATNTNHFSVAFEDKVELFGKTILTKKVCLSAVKEPKVGVHTLTIAPQGIAIYGSTIQVKVEEPPSVFLDTIPVPLPTQEPLLIRLSETDRVYDYWAAVEDNETTCSPRDKAILCDIPSLLLEQGERYELELKRSFQGTNVVVLGSSSIETLSATEIVASSIESSSVVYSKPDSIVLTTDKPLTSAEMSVELINKEGEKEEVPGEIAVQDRTITYFFKNELNRETDFIVTVSDVRAVDGSSLRSPYALEFTTSGGPKVESVNIGSYQVAPGATAIVTLDQQLGDSVTISDVARVKGISAHVSFAGNTIQFSLGSSDLCTTFSLMLDGVLTNKYGVENELDWSYQSRIRCHSISTIGYSVQGRPILAYSFGQGEPMLFIGAMHGNERSSGFLMDRFIDDLEANVTDIPVGRRVVVVPRVNPDAFIAFTRRNANNVDLNRNFPTNDWKSDVTMPGGLLIKGGGGEEPLSEPESKAIADFTIALRPKLALTYHAVANNVIANESGISAVAAKKYAELSGYENVNKALTSDVFEYDTNGAYEDWLYEKQDIAALLIELSSMSYSQFERNKPAMWAMLQL